MKSAVRLGLHEQGFWLPAERRRLWLGLAIAVVGPIALTPVIRTELFSELPGVPYLFAIVLATVVGRMLAAGVATLFSVALIDRYFLGDVSPFVLRSGSHLVAIAIFVLIAVIVAQLLVQLDRVTRASAAQLDRLVLLARAGDALSGTLDVEVALNRLGDILVPALADWFTVALVDESGAIATVLVVHPDPDKVALARELQRRFPADRNAPSGAPNVIRTGISELTERITDEMLRALVTDEELLAAIRPLGLRCAMVVPLSARGRTLGALTLVGAESHDRYTESDLRLAEEIGDRAALAIDTARLFEAESRARAEALSAAHRNAVLKDVTAAFGRAPTGDAVLAAMLDEGIRRVGAAAGTVGLVADGARVELVGTTGYEKDDHPYWHSSGLDEQLPMAEAIRERSEVVVTTTAERDLRYPALRGRGEQRDHALVCVPLLLGNEAIGAFSASYPPGTPFGQEDLGFLRALGEQCAQAIDRARSVERERATRARFNALAVASRTLARTLDPEETAVAVVRLATDHLGGRAAL
ncbi:MAG TPA: GAF domain-containing protein [Actinomycetota bacterium]|nr:GAF domain-containing protein [Actinomycetota bacterium]